jgi:hypothetical protein
VAHLVIPRRFNGPARSGNGGWSSGALAELLADGSPAVVTVRLRQPPPLDVPLLVERRGDALVSLVDGEVVSEAVLAETTPTPVAPVPVAAAVAAEARYAGHRHHPFPTCFTCGPNRRPGDGLRIFAGPVTGREGTVAATWTPYAVSVPITWAALDCPSAWASDIEHRPIVLGTMTAQVHALPSTSDRHVVVGELRGVEGRKTHTASTIYAPDGSVLATAEQVWIAIDPEDFA